MVSQCQDLHERSASLLNMISQLTSSVEQFLAARQVMHAKKPAEKKIEVEVVQAEMVDDN